MKNILQRLAVRAAGLAPDTLMLVGASAVSYGAGQVYVPAGWIIGGVFLLAAGVLAARKAG